MLFCRASNYVCQVCYLKIKCNTDVSLKIKKHVILHIFLKHSGLFLYLLIYAVRTYELYVKMLLRKENRKEVKICPSPHPHLMLPGQRENRASPQKGFIYAPFCPSLTLEGWVRDGESLEN